MADLMWADLMLIQSSELRGDSRSKEPERDTDAEAQQKMRLGGRWHAWR